MAKNKGDNIEQFLLIKRLTSAVCVVCIFLVTFGGLKANVSIAEISWRATLVILGILLAQTVLLKALSAWDIKKEMSKKNKLTKKTKK